MRSVPCPTNAQEANRMSTTPNFAAVLTSKKDHSNPPTLFDYLDEYFVSKGLPTPQCVDGVTNGQIHAGSAIEILNIATDIETWWLFTRWVLTEYGEQVSQAVLVRLYTDRNFYTQIRGKRYLVIVSSPFTDKDRVKEWAKNFLKVNIDSLVDPRPTKRTAPPLAQRPQRKH